MFVDACIAGRETLLSEIVPDVGGNHRFTCASTLAARFCALWHIEMVSAVCLRDGVNGVQAPTGGGGGAAGASLSAGLIELRMPLKLTAAAWGVNADCALSHESYHAVSFR